MMKIFNEIIDYSCFKEFQINELRDNLILPIKYDGIYFNCFVCEESNLHTLNIKELVKSKSLEKEEILFFLSDIEKRIQLFDLSKKSSNSEARNETFIEEFFSILINKAIETRTSDIHIESASSNMLIRFRVDGNLKIFYIFEKEFLQILSSYIKLL